MKNSLRPLPNNSVKYQDLTLLAQKLEYCDARLVEQEEKEWKSERIAQLKQYRNDLPSIIKPLNTQSILCQGTCYYLEHLYVNENAGLRNLAQIGYRLSIAGILGGICFGMACLVIAGSNYRVTRNFSLPITVVPLLFIISIGMFIGAYVANLVFLLLMRCCAKKEILDDDIENVVSSLSPRSDSQQHYQSQDDSTTWSNVDLSSDSPRNRDYTTTIITH